MARHYTVILYNQHEGTPAQARGRTRKEAFNNALRDAGETWLRCGSDKLTMLRTLFAENLMRSYYRTASHAYASHPIGCGVEFRREG